MAGPPRARRGASGRGRRRPRLARVVVAPDALEELVAGEHLALVAEEEREQLERLRLDRHRLAVAQGWWPARSTCTRPTRTGSYVSAVRVAAAAAWSARRKMARIRAVSSRSENGFVT